MILSAILVDFIPAVLESHWWVLNRELALKHLHFRKSTLTANVIGWSDHMGGGHIIGWSGHWNPGIIYVPGPGMLSRHLASF